MEIAGLFAGIGGIEAGMAKVGHHCRILCEIDPAAQAVLGARFPETPIQPDVRTIRSLPKVDLVAAGFPCQDLSQAGRTAGIRGTQSSLVAEVFRLVRRKETCPKWLMLENVPFMLQLERGKAMRYLVDELDGQGFMWAYRVVNTRAFGLPQRRLRVILLASRSEDPRAVLFASDAGELPVPKAEKQLCGFYWTEGLRGLGWAVDAVPTLKGGSTIGIPSPPGIWDPIDGSITTPDIRDVERLQGFEPDWTLAAVDVPAVRQTHRWKLIGNAVSVPVAQWVGRSVKAPMAMTISERPVCHGNPWPKAAWGYAGRAFSVDVSPFPERMPAPTLRAFLKFPRKPLSHRAALGFLTRARASGLKFEAGFLSDVERHIQRMARSSAA